MEENKVTIQEDYVELDDDVDEIVTDRAIIRIKNKKDKKFSLKSFKKILKKFNKDI